MKNNLKIKQTNSEEQLPRFTKPIIYDFLLASIQRLEYQVQ